MPNTRTNAPRGALVFDMRQLGRQAGSALSRSRTVPAPADLRLELVSVPEGAEVSLDVRFEAVTEGVLATGTATAPLAGECARCLAPLTSTVTVSFQELYLYSDGRPRGSRETSDKYDKRDKHDKRDKYSRPDEDEERDDEVRYLDGDLLDLEPALRDAVVLTLPMSPLCRDDCPGLCAECGVPLADAGPDHGHEDAIDPRWADLGRFDDQATQDQATQDQATQDQATRQQDRRARAIDLQEG
jgi:uncharacterized protein